MGNEAVTQEQFNQALADLASRFEKSQTTLSRRFEKSQTTMIYWVIGLFIGSLGLMAAIVSTYASILALIK